MSVPDTRPNSRPPRASQSAVQVELLFPIHCTGAWVSSTALSLAGAMNGPGLDVRMWVPSSEPAAHRPYLKDAVPKPLWKLLYRAKRPEWVLALAERRFEAAVAPGQLAYVFPGTSLKLLRKLKARGVTLVLERINCQESTAKPILDDAYRRLGLPGCPTMTDEDVRVSRETVLLPDRLFSPSPSVTRSLLEDGVPQNRIFESTFGWEPARLTGTHRVVAPAEGLTVLFVGTVCVRKGASLLLEAWARSGVRGRLLLAGRIEPAVAERCAALLNRTDVMALGHVADVGAAYRSADVFALPTLEEGSPLVSYEAMGSGLACVLSPMGAGAVARHGQEAFVLDPYDVEAWAETFRRLDAAPELRHQLGEQARARAYEFTWTSVGVRRREQITNWLDDTGASRQGASDDYSLSGDAGSEL